MEALKKEFYSFKNCLYRYTSVYSLKENFIWTYIKEQTSWRKLKTDFQKEWFILHPNENTYHHRKGRCSFLSQQTCVGSHFYPYEYQGRSNNLLLLQEFPSVSKLVHVWRPSITMEKYYQNIKNTRLF